MREQIRRRIRNSDTSSSRETEGGRRKNVKKKCEGEGKRVANIYFLRGKCVHFFLLNWTPIFISSQHFSNETGKGQITT